MKKTLALGTILFLGLAMTASAQSTVDKTAQHVKKGTTKAWQGTKKGASKAWQGTKKGAKHVSDESKEAASKTKATITDKKADAWTGPDGQTIYVDNSKYYWINETGKRIYVSQSALKAKQ